MSSTSAHYEALFASVVAKIGALSPMTSTGIVGFGEGGPVSMRETLAGGTFVTCELTLYPEQVPSAEGESYELLCRLPLDRNEVQDLLTALGALSMEAELGEGHTVDVSGLEVAPSLGLVKLRHFGSVLVGARRCGIYEVVAAS